MQVEMLNSCDESIGTEGGCEVLRCSMISKRTCECVKEHVEELCIILFRKLRRCTVSDACRL